MKYSADGSSGCHSCKLPSALTCGDCLARSTTSIVTKYARKFAVNPLIGQFTTGTNHAPLVYVGDSRKGIPSELEAHLISALRDSD